MASFYSLETQENHSPLALPLPRTFAQVSCSGLCQWGGTVGQEGGKEWTGERCWWGRDGNPGSGASPCDLGKVPFSLWASDFVPIKGKGCRRRFLLGVEQIPADNLPRVPAKQVLAVAPCVHLGASWSEPRGQWRPGIPGLQNHPVWAGA